MTEGPETIIEIDAIPISVGDEVIDAWLDVSGEVVYVSKNGQTIVVEWSDGSVGMYSPSEVTRDSGS